MTLSRRQFLLTATAAAIAPALPALPAAAAAPAVQASAAPLLAFAVGTPGEFDWQSIFARTAEDAYRIWRSENGGFDDEYDEDYDPPLDYDSDFVTRVPKWDNLTKVTPADWIRADMGHTCSRCNHECSGFDGAKVVGEDVVCECCVTIADLAVCDVEAAVEELADRIAMNDGDTTAVRDSLERDGHWEAISPTVWARAVAEAARG